MSLKKVFIDGTPLIADNLSGVGHVVLETVRALDASDFSKNHSIRIFLPFDEKGKLAKYKFKNISVVYLPIPHKFLSLFSRLKVSPPLDIFLGKGVYLFLNFRNWPLIYSKSITYIHDVAFTKYPEYIEPRNLKFLSKHIQRWIAQTNIVVAISNTTRDEIEGSFSVEKDKLKTVVNAVDTNIYKPQSDTDIKAIKNKYGLTDYVLFVSNIEPRKNILTLVNAFKLSRAGKEGQLFIVGGNGWLNEPITTAIEDAKAEGYDVIRNKSFVPDEDLPALMQGARTVVVPSWHEGFGLPLLQSVSSGGNVIASNIPALQEAASMVGNERVRFFNPQDTKALSRLIDNKDFLRTVTPNNKIRTWRNAVDDLIEIIQNLDKGAK